MNSPRKAFSQIYDECVDKIYRFIFLKVSSEEIAQDLCSETFLKGWQAFKKNSITLEDFEGPRYQRIGHIHKLLDEGTLDENLRFEKNGSP